MEYGEGSVIMVVVLSLWRAGSRDEWGGGAAGEVSAHAEPRLNRIETHRETRYLNKGQSTVNVSYSPPSPQTCSWYLAFCGD